MSLPLCLSVPLMEGFPLLTIPSPRHRPPASPQYLKLPLHAPRTRCLWLGCHSFTLESDPEAAGAAEPFLPGLSARVASQPLVDDREDGMHQGQGRSRTWQQGCPCLGTQSAFPFLSVEHKVSGR